MEIVLTKNKAELERLEGVIKENLTAFYEVGRALMQIKDKEYYSDVLGYETFEAYCRDRWDFTGRYARDLMASTRVIENIGTGTIVPVTESQCRPLAKLEPQQQVQAWEMAVETAPDGKVTAKHVAKVVKQMTMPTQTKEPVKTTEPMKEPSDAFCFVGIAISQLERIHPKDPNRVEALNKVLNWINKNL